MAEQWGDCAEMGQKLSDMSATFTILTMSVLHQEQNAPPLAPKAVNTLHTSRKGREGGGQPETKNHPTGPVHRDPPRQIAAGRADQLCA